MTFDAFDDDDSMTTCEFGPDTQDPRIMKLIAVAWAAGFIDGEGCIHLSRHQLPTRPRPTYRLVLSVSQNHRGCLSRLAATLGVPERIYSVKRSVKHNRDVFVLTVCDQHACAALRLLLPHLLRKRPEAEVAISAYVNGRLNIHPGPKGHSPAVWKTREDHYKKLRRMK